MDGLATSCVGGVLAALAALCSCTPSAQSPPAVEVSDSAGIRVVSNGMVPGRELLRPQQGRPLVRIGDRETPYGFFQRVTGGVLLRDGSIMVLDFGPREVRLYGPEGVFRKLVARQGEGPGEVRFPSDLGRLGGDSVHIWDRRLSRALLVSPSGELLDEVSVSTGGRRPPISLQRTGDRFVGSFQVLEGEVVVTSASDAELRMTPSALVRIGGEGVDRDTITLRPGGTYLQVGTGTLTPAVRRGAPWSLSAAGLVLGAGERPQFRVIDEGGTPIMIVRWHAPREPVSPDGLYAQAIEIAPVDRNHPMFDPQFLPDSMPAYMDIRTFSETIWVGAAAPFLLPSPRWYVFDFDGTWLATVELKGDTDVLDFSRDRLLVRETGELDVETVAIYPLSIGS